jgi:hypothetical protein
MPKRGEVIDVETAERMTQDMRHIDDELRPVIWPFSEAKKIHMSIDLSLESFPIRRALFHLECFEDDIDCWACVPLNSARGYAVMIASREADYDGNWTRYNMPVFWTQHKAFAQELRKTKGADPELIFSFEEVTEKLESLPMADDGAVMMDENLDMHLNIIAQAVAFEEYAFSPYATIKHRPTARQLRNPFRRQYPAIEVVNLRLPEIKDDPETTGRSINLRFPVIPHWRRQPTKEGIKLIRIEGHWRGPKDAPVKLKTEKVYKVIR